MTRNGANLRIYLNGAQLGVTNTALGTNAIDDLSVLAGASYTIGNSSDKYANIGLNGVISNLRVIKGIALSTGTTYTVPTAPLTVTPNTLLLYNYPYTTFYKNSASFVCAFGILSAQNYFPTVIKNSKLTASMLSSDRGSAISLNSSKLESFSVDSSTLSAYQDLELNTTRNILQGSYEFNNCTFGTGILSSVVNSYQEEVFTENGFVIMKENRIANKHYKLLRAGKISSDTTLAYGSNTVSEKLQPWSSTIMLRSGSKMIPVDVNASYTVGCYIYKSSGYTGAAPRLMLKRNIPLGYQDTVLAASVGANSSWEQLSGTVPAALDTGIFEVYVDCSGAPGCGSVNIDVWSLT